MMDATQETEFPANSPRVGEGLATRFMVPGWWVTAYEAAVRRTTRDLDPIALSREARLSPAFNAQELDGLTVILSRLQHQILAREPLRLDPAEHRRHISFTNQTRVFLYQRTLQSVTGMRLLRADGAGGFRAYGLFGSERWLPTEDGFVLQLEPRSCTPEILLGYGDPYVDLVRKATEQEDVQGLLCGRPPLALWQSAWLELSGAEQALLLRLEKAMQWEFRWLTLEGVFGIPIETLFAGIELPKSRKGTPGLSPFSTRLKILERLGRKLVDHGMLRDDAEADYLAMAPEEGRGSWLVWQVARDRVLPEEIRAYFRQACAYLVRHVYSSQFESIVKVLAGTHFDETLLKQVKAGWETIVEDSVGDGRCVVVLDETMPVMAGPLFLEWTIRQMPGHACPLPDELRQSAAARLADPTRSEPFGERFVNFCDALEDGRYRDEIVHTAGTSLVSEKTLREKAYQRYLVSARRVLEGRLESIAVSTPRPKQPALPPPPPKDVRRMTELPVGNIKKIAYEEIDRMRVKDVGRYEALKKAFFDSLDVTQRRMIQEMQQRAQPQLVEEQLKHQLVKFMVENPKVWGLPAPQKI